MIHWHLYSTMDIKLLYYLDGLRSRRIYCTCPLISVYILPLLWVLVGYGTNQIYHAHVTFLSLSFSAHVTFLSLSLSVIFILLAEEPFQAIKSLPLWIAIKHRNDSTIYPSIPWGAKMSSTLTSVARMLGTFIYCEMV